MKNLFKKFGVSSYTSVMAIIMTIISLIIYVVNSNLVYFRNLNSDVITYTVLALVFILASFVLSMFFGDKWFIGIGELLSAIFLTLAVTIAIIDRSTAIGFVWFSNLEADNKDAVFALNQSVIFMVTYLIALISVIVGSFFRFIRKPKVELNIAA